MIAVDPLSVTCPYCDAISGQRCVAEGIGLGALCSYARKTYARRVKLARVLAADADPSLDAHFPKLGQCQVCGSPGLDQRHRVVDAIAEHLGQDEDAADVAEEFGVTEEAVRAVWEWAARWGQ